MAKAVLPTRELMKGAADAGARAVQDRIVHRFLKALGPNGRS